MRRFDIYLIVCLFALIVQIIAPFSATYARAQTEPQADLLGLSDAHITCDHAGDADHPPMPPDHDSSCCILCTVSPAALLALPSDVPDSIAAPVSPPHKLFYEVTLQLPPAWLIPPLARPRAPPANS